jgi:hypothetical protein
MILLLVAFFILGSAMCALISLDRHSGADSGAIECDPLEIKPPHSTGVELLPSLTSSPVTRSRAWPATRELKLDLAGSSWGRPRLGF